jgi:hypothetical protein
MMLALPQRFAALGAMVVIVLATSSTCSNVRGDDLSERLLGDGWSVYDDRHASQTPEAQQWFCFNSDGTGTLITANLKAKPQQITGRSRFSWSVSETVGNACVLTITYADEDAKPTTMLLAFDGPDIAMFQRDDRINFLVRIKQKRPQPGSRY